MLCPKCQTPVRTISSTAKAEGYERRHRCRSISCAYAFYTLAPYDNPFDELPIKFSPLPFHDRPLTLIEENERLHWWEEADPEQVTFEGNARFLNRISIALGKQEGDRSDVEAFIMKVFMGLKQRVEAMDAEAKQKGEDE